MDRDRPDASGVANMARMMRTETVTKRQGGFSAERIDTLDDIHDIVWLDKDACHSSRYSGIHLTLSSVSGAAQLKVEES